MHYFSPAKLNLFFCLLGKREDGYHNIATLMTAINFFDRLAIKKAAQDQWHCSDSNLPMDDRNLVIQAIKLFRKKTGFSEPLSIFLEKNIPMGAGLGGGSSNAATALFAINRLAKEPLNFGQLKLLASRLGADVPFFFSSGSAYCTGKGEIFFDFSLLKPFEGFLFTPNISISTKKAYQKSQGNFFQGDPKELLKSFTTKNPLYFNSLEKAAFSLEPQLGFFKQKFRQLGLKSVVMTGSGSAFFFPSADMDFMQKFPFLPIQSVQRNPKSWYADD